MGRVCVGRLCYGPSLQWAEFAMGRDVQLPDKLVRNIIKARNNTLYMGRVCYGPSLCRPTLLWAEFEMGRVCYGPRCSVTHL